MPWPRSLPGRPTRILASSMAAWNIRPSSVAHPVVLSYDPHEGMPPLRVHRDRLNLTQDEVADRLCALAAEEGWAAGANAKMVSAWERGEKIPSRRYQRLLCRLYEVTSADLGCGVQGEGYPADDVRRRAFIRLAAGAAVGPLLETARRDIDPAFGRSVEDWEATVLAYGRAKPTTPPAELVARLTADLSDLGGALHGDRRLARVAASLSELTAGLLVRLDDVPAARGWYATALTAARESGDAELIAFVLGQHAILELYGDRSRVLGLADQALATASHPCAGAMSALSARAHVLAVMGRDRDARVALADAERMFERLPASMTGERVSHFGWAEQRALTMQEFVWARLGDTRRAFAAQDEAFKLYPAEHSRAMTRVQLDRAMCLVRDGDTTAGARHATASLANLPAGHRTRLVRIHARDVLTAIPERAQKSPAVVEYRELLA